MLIDQLRTGTRGPIYAHTQPNSPGGDIKDNTHEMEKQTEAHQSKTDTESERQAQLTMRFIENHSTKSRGKLQLLSN